MLDSDETMNKCVTYLIKITCLYCPFAKYRWAYVRLCLPTPVCLRAHVCHRLRKYVFILVFKYLIKRCLHIYKVYMATNVTLLSGTLWSI